MLYGLFDVRSKPSVIGRIVTATITLVTVLIVYDGWATLKFFDVALVVLSPIIAIFTAHIFSNSLVQQVELRRRPTVHEWLEVVRFESRLLLLAIPPLAVLTVLRLANVALTDAVQVLIWLEALSLIFWAGLAAWYAGLRGRLLALSILGGIVVAALVLLLQVLLEPGKAVNDGAAAALLPAAVFSIAGAATRPGPYRTYETPECSASGSSSHVLDDQDRGLIGIVMERRFPRTSPRRGDAPSRRPEEAGSVEGCMPCLR